MRSARFLVLTLTMSMALFWTTVHAAPPASQFLLSTPELKALPDVEGAYGWDNPKMKVSDFDKVFLDEMEIFLASDSPYQGIDTRQMAALSETMRAVMTATLEPEYPVVSQPGPGVMRISMALTNVKIEKKDKNILQFTPIGLVVGGLRGLADAFKNISLDSSVVEANIVDIQSGEPITVRMATKPFAQAKVSEGEMSWDALKDAFGFYAKEVRRGLDEAHGK